MVLFVTASVWIAADLHVVIGNAVLRETRLGVIARLLDRLPGAFPIPFSFQCGLFFFWDGPYPSLSVLKTYRARTVPRKHPEPIRANFV
jgi:hypothetical protein